jgi:hypothetical protein
MNVRSGTAPSALLPLDRWSTLIGGCAILTLASGKADALSGCFLSVDDDLDALLAQADAIRSEGRLRLRLAE